MSKIKQLFTMRRALTDPRLLGNVIPSISWLPHRILAIASQGEELSNEEREIYKYFTGREREPGRRVKEFAAIAGRRSGKTVLDGLMITYLSSCVDYSNKLRPGETGVCLCLAQTQGVAKQLLDLVEENLRRSEILKQRFVRRTSELIELTNNIQIEVRPASGRKLRGPTFISIICDELAHWQVEEFYQDPDVEILAGARPGMTTMRTEGDDWGMVVMTSSPSIRRGLLWDMYDKHYGKDDPDYLVCHGTTRAFNPLVPQEEIDRALKDDPYKNRAEYLAEFLDSLEKFVDRAAAEDCISPGVFERPWQYGYSFLAFIDPATGSGPDSFTLCVGHAENGDTVVIDLLREWKPQPEPFKMHEVIDEICTLCKSYCIYKVISDKTGKWLESHFTHRGSLLLECSAKPKHELYLTMLPYVNSARIKLLDHQRSLDQLLSLERTRTQIDHPPRMHDDLINAVAGVADIAIGRGSYNEAMWKAAYDD